jgi:hypothetical protein
VIAVAAGGAVVLPSLALLFHLFLRGHLVPAAELQPAHRTATDPRPPAWLVPLAGVSLLGGSVLMVLLESGWAHVAGVLCLFTCAASVFVLAATPAVETSDTGQT